MWRFRRDFLGGLCGTARLFLRRLCRRGNGLARRQSSPSGTWRRRGKFLLLLLDDIVSFILFAVLYGQVLESLSAAGSVDLGELDILENTGLISTPNPSKWPFNILFHLCLVYFLLFLRDCCPLESLPVSLPDRTVLDGCLCLCDLLVEGLLLFGS